MRAGLDAWGVVGVALGSTLVAAAGRVVSVSGFDGPRPVSAVDESGRPVVEGSRERAGWVAEELPGIPRSAAGMLADRKAAGRAVEAVSDARHSPARPVSAMEAFYKRPRGESGDSGAVVAGRAGPDVDGPVDDLEAPLDSDGSRVADLSAGNERDPVDGHNGQGIPVELRERIEWRKGDDPLTPDLDDLKYRDPVLYVRPAGEFPGNGGSGDGHRSHTLGRGEAWPSASHSAAERQMKIAEGHARGAEAVGSDAWSNSKFAGERYRLSDELGERYPDGVDFSYESFPIFEKYAIKVVQFEDGFAPRRPNGRADRSTDNDRANEIFGWAKEPRGTTWHHKEDGRTMILMDRPLHRAVGHWGGERVVKIKEQREAGG